MTIEIIVVAVITSIVYALSMYLKKALSADNPQTFDYYKIGATVVVGGLVGLVVSQTGTLPTEVGVETQMAIMGGLVVLSENVLKIVYRAVVKYTPT